ncbi:OB-fold domain-containing protein [Mycolicibacterium brumae]|uniref:DNA-binding protein n=2 Tax=Mycolicibacterium brumae TaxID=85968 RepID=A0A2G5PHJ2_9MYCO|nr:OB-fold domain-containing protein [Mycolicibacterium brumae]PIB77778.1 DNA-binding protein [Mycolicibacterium brumae]
MTRVDGRVRLLGGRCGQCGEIDFPRKEFCRRCGGGEIEVLTLADRGALWSWTIQRFAPPSPPYGRYDDDFEPFGVGYVELPGEVIIEARLTENDPARLRIGMPMTLTTAAVRTGDGSPTTTFAFAPEEPQ